MHMSILNIFPTEKYRTSFLRIHPTRSSSLHFSVLIFYYKVVSTSNDKQNTGNSYLLTCKTHIASTYLILNHQFSVNSKQSTFTTINISMYMVAYNYACLDRFYMGLTTSNSCHGNICIFEHTV